VGIYAFPKILDSGYRNITTSNRPINSIDDLKGMKMRVPPSPVWVSLFTALGSALHIKDMMRHVPIDTGPVQSI